MIASAEDSFIITGDIPAMWLRDSTNQVAPYLPLLKHSPELSDLVKGLIARQARCIVSDPWANAFKEHPASANSEWAYADKVKPAVSDLVFESKFELDSLAAFLKISNQFVDRTGDTSIVTTGWMKALESCLGLMISQQQGTLDELENPTYLFQRSSNVPTDTLMLSGRGPPAKRCGLIRCGFRPSDDACTLPFLIPANAMTVVELRKLSQWMAPINKILADKCEALSLQVGEAIEAFGIIKLPNGDRVYAYEVDGFGNYYLMDDANIPSLLSLPYLGFVDAQDPVYLCTRRLILSPQNPYYFSGKAGQGIGGPHIGLGYIWPMSIAMQALTSKNEKEKESCVQSLIASTASTGLIHESFWMNDASQYTRSWFAWANSLVGELLYQMAKESGCTIP